MEEILASIRRIIADDDHEPVRRPVARREDPTEMRRPDAPRPDAGRAEPARPATARPEVARGPVAEQRMPAPPADRMRHEADRTDHFGLDALRPETPRPAPVRPPEVRRAEVSLGEAARPALRPEPIRAEPPHSEPVRYGTQRPEAQYSNSPDAARAAPRPEPVSVEIARADVGRLDPLRSDSVRRDAVRSEHGPSDGQGAHLARPEALHAAVERAVADSQFSQDERRSPGHDAELVARHPERDEAAAQPRPAALRAESAPEAVRPMARPVADARPSRPSVTPEARRKDLLSPAVDAAVMAAFESLGDVSLGQTALPEQGRTVEDLIKEILRPMLKTWLDDHLPDIVERLVRAEIERVARNGR